MAEEKNKPNEPKEEKVLVENNDVANELPLISEEVIKEETSKTKEQNLSNGKKGKKKTTKTARKYMIYITMMVIVSALAVYFVMKNDPGAVIDAIAKCNVGWVLGAFAVIISSFLIEGLILTILARMYKPKYPFYKGVLNTMIGIFFSGITPSNSGGQFVQAYTFSKQGIKITNFTTKSINDKNYIIAFGTLASNGVEYGYVLSDLDATTTVFATIVSSSLDKFNQKWFDYATSFIGSAVKQGY